VRQRTASIVCTSAVQVVVATRARPCGVARDSQPTHAAVFVLAWRQEARCYARMHTTIH
jgi:hypothetical protein